jgi:hypothetical protein
VRRCVSGGIGALLILAWPLGAQAILDDALVLYFSFDAGAGKTIEDQSGNANDGSLEGSPEWTGDGKMKSAMSFNGDIEDGVVVVTASESLTITESFTMEVWVYPQSIGDYSNLHGQANPHTYYLSIHQSKPAVWLGTAGAGGKTWLLTENPIPLDQWSHVAAVYDFDNELRLYIDGKLDNTHELKGAIDPSPGDHWFGNRLDGPWPYEGRLDEFAIYSRALSEAEIRQDMEAVLSVSQRGKLSTTWGQLKQMASSGR